MLDVLLKSLARSDAVHDNDNDNDAVFLSLYKHRIPEAQDLPQMVTEATGT